MPKDVRRTVDAEWLLNTIRSKMNRNLDYCHVTLAGLEQEVLAYLKGNSDTTNFRNPGWEERAKEYNDSTT